MKKIWTAFLSGLLLIQTLGWANSVSLLNDSIYTLRAEIYGADGALLGEFTLNPRDANEWSDDYENFGTGNAYAPEMPYTVNWYCMSGTPFGSCSNVAAGALVTAQSCGGAQECQQNPQQPPSEM